MSYWRSIETDPPPTGDFVLLSFDRLRVFTGYKATDGSWRSMAGRSAPPSWWAPMPVASVPAPGTSVAMRGGVAGCGRT